MKQGLCKKPIRGLGNENRSLYEDSFDFNRFRLWAILLKPVFISENVAASTGIIDVNIKQIDGKRASSVLDVNIEKVNGRTYFGTSIPVSIGK